jgi:hypothetical protein
VVNSGLVTEVGSGKGGINWGLDSVMRRGWLSHWVAPVINVNSKAGLGNSGRKAVITQGRRGSLWHFTTAT